jgi:hypothetical protein
MAKREFLQSIVWFEKFESFSTGRAPLSFPGDAVGRGKIHFNRFQEKKFSSGQDHKPN